MSRKRKIYLCTIYPEQPSIEAMYNLLKLQDSERLDVQEIFVRAGTFSHRHPKWKPDEQQCKIRQLYLDQVPDGEWILVLDDDELLLAPGDNIADFLDYLDVNDCEVGFIIEKRGDGKEMGRPRLIKKKEGLIYGSDTFNWKHDHILDTETGRNYIDINNQETAMDLPIYFYHVKNSGKHMFLKHSRHGELKLPDWIIQEKPKLEEVGVWSY